MLENISELENFARFCEAITDNNSRLYKLAVLESFKNDEDIKYFLNFIYNPYLITGISDKKLFKNISSDTQFTAIYNLKNLCEYLLKNNTGKNEQIACIQNFRNKLNDYNKDLVGLFDSIITKNLNIGVTAKTINKIIPNLIPEFQVQLANKYFEHPEYVKGKEFSITTKIDGSRLIAIKKNGKVSFYSRSGQSYEGLVDLQQELLDLPLDDICFDGELTLLDKGNLTSKDQYKQTMKIIQKDGEKHGLKMLVFDYLPASDFIEQKTELYYTQRRAILDNIFDTYTLRYFHRLPVLYSGNDINEINQWLSYNVSHGEEGIMININDSPYEFKRTNNLLKVKLFNTYDLEIVGFEEGTNRFQGMLGSLIVRYKDGNLVKVGSGISESLRKEIWKNPDFYVGKIIEVSYFEETTNQNGGLSLRFPVFKSFRTDKLEPDF